QHREIHPARPVARDGQGVARSPVAGDETGGCVRCASVLLRSGEATLVETQAASQAAVPTDAIDVDAVRLRRVDRDEEVDGRVLIHAGGRRVSLYLPGRVVGDQRPELPAARAGQLVLRDHRV